MFRKYLATNKDDALFITPEYKKTIANIKGITVNINENILAFSKVSRFMSHKHLSLLKKIVFHTGFLFFFFKII